MITSGKRQVMFSNKESKVHFCFHNRHFGTKLNAQLSEDDNLASLVPVPRLIAHCACLAPARRLIAHCACLRVVSRNHTLSVRIRAHHWHCTRTPKTRDITANPRSDPQIPVYRVGWLVCCSHFSAHDKDGLCLREDFSM